MIRGGAFCNFVAGIGFLDEKGGNSIALWATQQILQPIVNYGGIIVVDGRTDGTAKNNELRQYLDEMLCVMYLSDSKNIMHFCGTHGDCNVSQQMKKPDFPYSYALDLKLLSKLITIIYSGKILFILKALIGRKIADKVGNIHGHNKMQFMLDWMTVAWFLINFKLLMTVICSRLAQDLIQSELVHYFKQHSTIQRLKIYYIINKSIYLAVQSLCS